MVYTHGSQYPGYKNEIANAGETSSNSNRDKSRLTSFLGRVNYNFDNTYYAGVSYRVMEVLVCQGIIVGEIFGQYPDLGDLCKNHF